VNGKVVEVKAKLVGAKTGLMLETVYIFPADDSALSAWSLSLELG
jgi:hypothetical protein